MVCRSYVSIALAAMLIVSLTTCPAEAQTAAPADGGATARLPWGDPDLQGVWNYATITPLERPAEFAGKPILTPEEVTRFEQQFATVQNRDRRDGVGTDEVGSDGRSDVARAYNEFWWDRGNRVVSTRQSSLVVDPPDGKIPALTAEAQRAAQNRPGRLARPAGPEDRGLGERCIVWGIAGPPMMPGAYNNNVELLQAPGYVLIFNEMIHDFRIVPLDARPQIDRNVRQWMGSSRGRWEGNTLVVETTNFTPKRNFRGATGNLHLIERFTRTDANTLEYKYTVTDPSVFTRPWTASIPMTRSSEPIYEYACHEGNYGLTNILSGARAEEKAEGAGRNQSR